MGSSKRSFVPDPTRRFVGKEQRANFASTRNLSHVRDLHCVRRGATARSRRPPASLIMGVPKTKVRALACFARLSRPRIVPDAPAFPPRLPRFPIADTPNSVDPTNAVVPGGGGGAPQGREEVRRRQVALHPKGSGARQDPEPAIQRGPQGERARHRRDPSLSHRRRPPARPKSGGCPVTATPRARRTFRRDADRAPPPSPSQDKWRNMYPGHSTADPSPDSVRSRTADARVDRRGDFIHLPLGTEASRRPPPASLWLPLRVFVFFEFSSSTPSRADSPLPPVLPPLPT